MRFEIYSFCCHYPYGIEKKGFLLHSSDGYWSEVSPFPGKNQETLGDVLEQLKALQQGWNGNLFPSVAFGIHSLIPLVPASVPICLLLMGSLSQILQAAERPHFATAKVKLGDFDIETAKELVGYLKQKFHLRIDVEKKWSPSQTRKFCSYFTPSDFECIEDPICDISPYPMVTEDNQVWKPMVRGIPMSQANIILSSTFESGVGICHISTLAKKYDIPYHPLGIGTYLLLQEDLLKEPLQIEKGHLIIPSYLAIDTTKITRL